MEGGRESARDLRGVPVAFPWPHTNPSWVPQSPACLLLALENDPSLVHLPQCPTLSRVTLGKASAPWHNLSEGGTPRAGPTLCLFPQPR